jgi:hypothetical protein
VNEVRILVTSKDETAAGFDSAERKAKGLGATITGVGRKMTDLGAKATTRITLPIVAGFGLAERAATNLGEAQNAANVVFADAAPTIIAASRESQKLGMSQRQLLEAVTPIGAALQNTGFSAQEAAGHSVELTKRAADMASVFNTDVDEALMALQAGLRGEADPLERFGVGLSDAAVTAEALRMGLADTADELDANDKAQARLSLIMKQTDKIAGDFANTSDSNANQLRIQKAAAEDAAAAFGQGLQPIMAKLLKTGAGLLDWFNELSPQWQQFIIFAGLALAALGPLITVIGALVTAIGGVVTALTFLAAHPIVLALIALIAVIVLLIFHWDKVKAAAGVAWEFIKGKAMDAFNWIKRNWPLILAILTGPIGLAVLAIVRNWDTIKAGFTDVKDWIAARINNIVGFFQGLPGRIGGAIQSIYNKVVFWISAAKNWVRDRVDDIVDFIWSIPSRIVGIGSAIKDRIVSGLGNIVDAINPFAHGGVTGAQAGGVRGGWKMVGEHGRELVRLAPGSRVYGNAMTEGMMASAGGAGGGGVVVNLNVAGSLVTERELMKMVRDEFRRGGFGGAFG